MNKLNKKPLTRLQSLKMSSVSSVQVTKKSSNLQPYVRLKRLNLQSAASFRIPSVSINKCFIVDPEFYFRLLSLLFNVFHLLVNVLFTEDAECILLSKSAMLRGAYVVEIFLVTLLLHLQLMAERSMSKSIQTWIALLATSSIF